MPQTAKSRAGNARWDCASSSPDTRLMPHGFPSNDSFTFQEQQARAERAQQRAEDYQRFAPLCEWTPPEPEPEKLYVPQLRWENDDDVWYAATSEFDLRIIRYRKGGAECFQACTRSTAYPRFARWGEHGHYESLDKAQEGLERVAVRKPLWQDVRELVEEARKRREGA